MNSDNNSTQSVVFELSDSLQQIDDIVNKSFLNELSSLDVKPFKLNYKASSTSRFFSLKKIVYDKKENNIQKLTNLYSAVASVGGNVAMLIKSDGKTVNLYFGICDSSDTDSIRIEADLLRSSFNSNFQGSLPNNTERFIDNEELDILTDQLFPSHNTQKTYIASVSAVASSRNEKFETNDELFQGMEKFIESMNGQSFTAVFIADTLSPNRLSAIKAEYEVLYSQLSALSERTLSMALSNNESITESISESFSHAVGKNQSESLSIGKTKTTGATVGAAAGASVGVASASVFTSISKSVSKSENKTTTKGRSETDTDGHSNTKSTTAGTSTTNTVQIVSKNKTVIDLLDKIDKQLKRIESSKAFGMFATAAYFISYAKDISLVAANVYKSIISGPNTANESASVNLWSDQKKISEIYNYLKVYKHPEFIFDKRIESQTVTPASLVSAQELAIQFGLPKKSVSGITVINTASFGRNVLKSNIKENDDSIILGNLYHLGQEEQHSVSLNKNSFAMHTFITGSTGSGKSNTVYSLLDSLSHEKVKFLIIEPAKGEYKNVFGGRNDVSVYGTNPNINELLRINPFAFPSDIHVLEHLDRLVEIFNVCWPMYAAMPAVLKDAMEMSYIDAGWDLAFSTNPYGKIYPTFKDVLLNISTVINNSQYSADTKGDYKGALETRIRTLTTGLNGLIFTSDSIDDISLFDNNVIIDLSRVGSVETKSLIMGILIMKLNEHRMAQGGMNSELKHITVLEEAHNILKRTSTEQNTESSNLLGKSVEMIANSIAEMRTYGEGFIVVDQSPGLMDMSVIRNTNTKIILRLPDKGDRELVGYAAGLNEDQLYELSKLECGVAAVYQNDWIEPVLIKINRFSNKSPYNQSKVDLTIHETSEDLTKELLHLIMTNEILHLDSNFIDKARNSSLPAKIRREIIKLSNSTETKEKNRCLRELTFAFFNSATVARIVDQCETAEECKKKVLNALVPSVAEFPEYQQQELIAHLLCQITLINGRFNEKFSSYMDTYFPKEGGFK